MISTNFVNDARNIVWLSGYARSGGDGTLLLFQSTNADRAIPVHLARGMKAPGDNAAVEIKCHAYAMRDAEGNHAIRLDAILIKRASVTAIPRRLAFANLIRGKKSDPFMSLDGLKDEIRNTLQLSDETVDAIMADARKSAAAKQGFVNKVILTGFVGTKAYIPPSDDGEMGYVAFRLHQHPEDAKTIQVRVTNADQRFGKELKSLHPVNVIGEVFVEAIKDEEGNTLERRLSIRSRRENIGLAVASDFAAGQFPSWWRQAIATYYEQRRAAQVQQAAPRAEPELAMAEDAVPGGVTVSDDEI